MKILLSASLLIFGFSARANFSNIHFPDTTKNIIDKTKIQYKLTDGKHKFYEHNYRGSLTIYREVLAVDEGNAKAHYGIAECQYALNNFDAAKEHAELAYKTNIEVDKEVHYLLGNIYFRLGELDKAIESYEKFKTTIPNEKKQEDYDINLLLAQANYAKAHIKDTVGAKIVNIGDAINSSAPEMAPCISPDGQSLVFTSRRPDTKGGQVDVNFDHLYYSDVYISTKDENGNWQQAESMPGKINTEFHDSGLSFTYDGELIIYRNISEEYGGATRSGDIYTSKLSKSGRWGTPKPILYKYPKISKKINSSYFESSASITEDGNQIYFVSDRPGGQGMADIYMVEKKGKDWTEPVNIGPAINTSSDEKCVYIHPSGNIIFFSSNGLEESMGSYDFYYSVKNGDTWSKPVNMGFPVNTTKEEKTIAVSADGKTAYVSAYYDEDSKGDADIFVIDISYLNLPVK